MFRDIDRGAAIFAAKRQALQDAQADDGEGRRQADHRGRRHQPDACGRKTHQRDGDEEGVFATELVAEEAEQHRSQRAKAEADREHRPSGERADHFIVGGEKGLTDDPAGSERAVDEEVIPFEHGAERRGGDDKQDVVPAGLWFGAGLECDRCNHDHADFSPQGVGDQPDTPIISPKFGFHI